VARRHRQAIGSHPSRARLSRADATGDSTQLGRLAKGAREDGVLYALIAGQWYEVRASFIWLRWRSAVRPTAAQGTIFDVPTISRFFGIVIAMFFDDHEPPHFHARHAEGSAKIRIDTVEVIDSSLGRRQLRFVLAWAELHQEELLENWRLARSGETLREIEPLR
jgi:hypothetical protein